MPLYEVECEQCGHRFEVIRKFSDDPLKICPSCGGTVRKLFSSPAFHFKGTGWYVTDYARKNQDSSSKSSTESDAKKESPKTGSVEKSDESAAKSSSESSGGTKGAEKLPDQSRSR